MSVSIIGRLRRISRSSFWRTLFLVSTLLLINLLATYVLVAFYFVKPSLEQTSQLVANQMQSYLYLEQQKQALPPESEWHQTFSEAQKLLHIQKIFSDNPQYQQLEHTTSYFLIADEIEKKLHYPVQVRLSNQDEFDIWIQRQGDPAWYKVHVSSFNQEALSPLFVFLVVIAVLSIVAGIVFVLWLNRPLRKLQNKALAVGRGEYGEPLAIPKVTELANVTQAFNQMSESIQQLDSDRTFLLASLSHDLRTPMTRLRLAVEILADSVEENPIYDGMVSDLNSMDVIVQQFMEYLHLPTAADCQPISLNALVEDVVEEWRYVTADTVTDHITSHDTLKGNEREHIRFDLDASIPQVLAHELSMRRVVMNLIENAKKYGQFPIDIQTRYLAKKRFVQLSIRDHGSGVPDEALEYICEAFQQFDSSRQHQGTGLGLAIVERFVKAQRGQLAIDNHPVGGLRVTIRLPVAH